MIIDKKVSKPELAVEAITVESDPSIVAESAVKPLNFEVCSVTVVDNFRLLCALYSDIHKSTVLKCKLFNFAVRLQLKCNFKIIYWLHFVLKQLIIVVHV